MLVTSDPTYPLFPVLSFLAFFLVLTPLPWHFQAWNAGTCLYMIWSAVGCLNLFVNSVVWHGNALNPAPVWCDISSRLIVGVSIAIPTASLCINRRLYKIATMTTPMVSRSQKRRAVYEDLAIGLGVPVVQIALQYIVSGHRFNIFGDIGCYPVTINVWLTYVLVAAWPIVIGLISAVYCVLSLRAFVVRNASFNELLATNSALTKNRYLRLMALATTELVCTTPFAAYSIFLNLTAEPLTPYRGWADLHFNYSKVDQIPAVLWRTQKETVIALELSRWLVVACAFVFFAYFGFADEARRHYKIFFTNVLKRLGIHRFSNRKPALLPLSLSEKKKPVTSSGGFLPIFIARPKPAVDRDSLFSVDPSDSNEKLVRTTSLATTSKSSPPRLSSSNATLAYPADTKSDSSGPESPYSECYGHAY